MFEPAVNVPNDAAAAASTPSSIISVEHIFKSVSDSTGTLTILRDIHFALAPRETAAIVGASGSGKSTLLSIIAGLDTPTQGTVHLAGQNLFALSEDDRAALRAQKVGFVFQSFQLMGNLNALENVMLPLELSGAKNARAQATEMLRRVGLGERLGAGPGFCGAASGPAGRRAHRQPGLCHWREGDGADVRTEPGTGHDAGAGNPRLRHRRAL